MNTLRKRIAVALLVLTAVTTLAANRNGAVYLCMPSDDAVAYTTPKGQGLLMGGTSSYLFCPLLDDSGQVDRGLVTPMTLTVRLNDTSPTVTGGAQACVQFYGVNGVACGSAPTTGTTFVGTATLSPTTSVWHNFPSDFAYVLVSLGTGFKMYGYRVTQ